MSMAVDDGIWIGIGATVVIVTAGVVTYKVVKKRKAGKVKESAKAAAAAAVKKTAAEGPSREAIEKARKAIAEKAKKSVADVKKKVVEGSAAVAKAATSGDEEPAAVPAEA